MNAGMRCWDYEIEEVVLNGFGADDDEASRHSGSELPMISLSMVGCKEGECCFHVGSWSLELWRLPYLEDFYPCNPRSSEDSCVEMFERVPAGRMN